MHPELEALIEASIEDGMVSDEQWRALILKARAVGFDTDELNLVVDARLHTMRREAAQEDVADREEPEPLS